MKRTLYRGLHRRLRRYSGPTSAAVATVVLTVPDPQVPRWSPGPDWTEMSTARLWMRPIDDDRVQVMARSNQRQTTALVDDRDVLLTGITDELGTVADKKHRLYSVAEPGSLHAEPIADDHPAERYWRAFVDTSRDFHERVQQLQDQVDQPMRYRTLDLWPTCELRPDGHSWAMSLDVTLRSHTPEAYWSDLARAADVIAALSRSHRARQVQIYSGDVAHLVDPLAHNGWRALDTPA